MSGGEAGVYRFLKTILMYIWPENHCLKVFLYLAPKLAGFAQLAFPSAVRSRNIILYPCPSRPLDSHPFPVFRDARASWGYSRTNPLLNWHPKVLGTFGLPEHPRMEMGLEHAKLIPTVPSHGRPCLWLHSPFLLLHLKMAWTYLVTVFTQFMCS